MPEELIYMEADEVFELAEQIERNGAEYYTDAAELVSDPKTKGMLLAFSDMEEEHGNTFRNLRSKAVNATAPADPEAGKVARQYVRAWADMQVFGKNERPAEMLAGMNQEEIIKFAIGLEKDSIVFYTGLKSYVHEEGDKEELEKIIKEEMQHIVTLTGLLGKIRK